MPAWKMVSHSHCPLKSCISKHQKVKSNKAPKKSFMQIPSLSRRQSPLSEGLHEWMACMNEDLNEASIDPLVSVLGGAHSCSSWSEATKDREKMQSWKTYQDTLAKLPELQPTLGPLLLWGMESRMQNQEARAPVFCMALRYKSSYCVWCWGEK